MDMHRHTTKSTSSFQEEMADLPAATTATSAPTSPEHTDHRRRLCAHAVELWSNDSSVCCKLLSGCKKQVGAFLIRRTRECCASKFVCQGGRTKGVIWNHQEFCCFGVVGDCD